MNRTQWFLILVIILWLLYFYQIDPIERRLLWAFLRWGEPNSELLSQVTSFSRSNRLVTRLITWLTKLGVLIGILIYPILLTLYLILFPKKHLQINFAEKWFYHLSRPISHPCLEGGGIYSMLAFIDQHQRLPNFGGKVFWMSHFQKHQVGHPKMYGLFGGPDREKEKMIKQQLPKHDFLVKPEWGSRGKGIEIWRYLGEHTEDRYRNTQGITKTGSELIATWQQSPVRMLAMEIVKQAKTTPYPNYPQHARIVTYRVHGGGHGHDGKQGQQQIKIFIVQYGVQFQKGQFKSNHAQEAKVWTNIWPGDTRIDGKKALPWLNLAFKQAQRLHSDLPVFSIGWDVILTDQGPKFLEGNLCHSLGDYYEFKTYYQSLFRYEQAFRHYYQNR